MTHGELSSCCADVDCKLFFTDILQTTVAGSSWLSLHVSVRLRFTLTILQSNAESQIFGEVVYCGIGCGFDISESRKENVAPNMFIPIFAFPSIKL